MKKLVMMLLILILPGCASTHIYQYDPNTAVLVKKVCVESFVGPTMAVNDGQTSIIYGESSIAADIWENFISGVKSFFTFSTEKTRIEAASQVKQAEIAAQRQNVANIKKETTSTEINETIISSKYHHYNPKSWNGKGTSIVFCTDSPEFDACEINGKPMKKHSNKDKGRRIWTRYTDAGLAGAVTCRNNDDLYSFGPFSSDAMQYGDCKSTEKKYKNIDDTEITWEPGEEGITITLPTGYSGEYVVKIITLDGGTVASATYEGKNKYTLPKRQYDNPAYLQVGSAIYQINNLEGSH